MVSHIFQAAYQGDNAKKPFHSPRGSMSYTSEGWRGQSSPTPAVNTSEVLTAEADNTSEGSPAPAVNTSEGKRQHRRQLNPARALEIFKLRPYLKHFGQPRNGATLLCRSVAPQFGVSPKTVREIWAGRAWARATRKEWTQEEIATGALSSFSRMMCDDSSASNSVDTTVLHSLTGALGPVAPPRQDHPPPMLNAGPLFRLNNVVVPSLQSLLAAAYAPQQAAGPQAHTNSTAQLLPLFSGHQTAPPQPAWGFRAAQPVPAQDLESAISYLQATLAQLLAKSQAQLRQSRPDPTSRTPATSSAVSGMNRQHPPQQQQQQQQQLEQQQLRQHHAIERAVAAVGWLRGQHSLVEGLPPWAGGMLASQQQQHQLRHHAIEKAVATVGGMQGQPFKPPARASLPPWPPPSLEGGGRVEKAVGRMQGQQSLVVGLPLSPSGMLSANMSLMPAPGVPRS